MPALHWTSTALILRNGSQLCRREIGRAHFLLVLSLGATFDSAVPYAVPFLPSPILYTPPSFLPWTLSSPTIWLISVHNSRLSLNTQP